MEIVFSGLKQKVAELHRLGDRAERWRRALAPLVELICTRAPGYFQRLATPLRGGLHGNSAFSLALMLDAANVLDAAEPRQQLAQQARRLFTDDVACPAAYEPSGTDFLSPCLAEADLVRRVMAPDEFARWLGGLLPDIPHRGETGAWLEPAVVTDASDGKLAHLDGLNLSRAWMLEGIASALRDDDPRRAVLLAAADEHRAAGLAAVTGEHYEGGHWLGTFATYLVTERGLR